MMNISEQKKKAGEYCCAHGCYSMPVLKKGGLCHKHYRIKCKERDPVQIRYNEFVHNARKRGKEKVITLAQFRAFCDDTGYYLTKAMRGNKVTLDRPKNWLGYSIYNIQLLSGVDNIKKYWQHDRPEGFLVPDNYTPPSL